MSMVMPRAFSSGRRSQSMPVRRLDKGGLAVVDVAGGAEDQVAGHVHPECRAKGFPVL